MKVKVMMKIGIGTKMMTNISMGGKGMMENKGNDIDNEKEINGMKREQKEYGKKKD
jgi:hypothetical protein